MDAACHHAVFVWRLLMISQACHCWRLALQEAQGTSVHQERTGAARLPAWPPPSWRITSGEDGFKVPPAGCRWSGERAPQGSARGPLGAHETAAGTWHMVTHPGKTAAGTWHKAGGHAPASAKAPIPSNTTPPTSCSFAIGCRGTHGRRVVADKTRQSIVKKETHAGHHQSKAWNSSN